MCENGVGLPGRELILGTFSLFMEEQVYMYMKICKSTSVIIIMTQVMVKLTI